MSVDIFKLSAEALSFVRSKSPVDTGHLRDMGITLKQTSPTSFEIEIGGETAPYAVYTNELWVSPRWKGRQNPNLHWIDNAVEELVQNICAKTGGRLAKATGIEDRRANVDYWFSEEGMERLRSYIK